MAVVEPLSIDVSGTWSHRKARKVIEALRLEARALNLRLAMVDISTHDRPHRAIISMRCALHDQVVAPDSACTFCIRGVIPR